MKRVLLFLICLANLSLFAQVYNMPNSINNTPIVTCNGTFYDAGGALGNHGTNQNSRIVFQPGNPNMSIRLVFNVFTVGEGAVMTIWDAAAPTGNSADIIATYDAFINPTGLAIVATATNQSNGAICIEFVSGSANEIGWEADITCRAPCQGFNAVIDPALTTKPIVDELYFNACMNDCLDFAVKGDYFQNNINYHQDDNNTMFIWRFGYSGLDTGRVITRCFEEVKGWDFTVYGYDTMGCYSNSLFKGRVRVSDNPLAGIPPIPDVCAGGHLDMRVGTDPLADIQVTTVGHSVSGTLSHADTTFLPDGSNISYTSDLVYDIFDPGQTLSNINHLLGVTLCLEHSYMGDLSIRLTCPSGQTVVLKAYSASNPALTGNTTVATPGSLSGGGTWLGFAPDPSSNNPCYLTPGVGFDYTFSPTSTVPFGTDGPKTTVTYTDPCNNTQSNHSQLNAGTYGAYQTMTNLLGCPLNGTWTITVTDHLAADNGYIFRWELALDQSIIPGGWEYNVAIDTVIWDGANIHPTSNISSRIDLIDDGQFNYNFTIIDEYGCEYDSSFTVNILPAPNPDLGEDPKLCTGEMIILNANYEHPNVSYWWNTGATSDEIMVLTEGEYYVRITTVNEDSTLICTGSDTVYVSVNPQPVPEFEVDVDEGCAPLKVQFTDLTTPTDIGLSYEWRVINFDGELVATSNVQNPGFELDEPSSYHVQLIVTTDNGCVDSIVKWNFITVYAQPIAAFEYDPEVSLYSESQGVVNFINYCDSTLYQNDPTVSWHWDYGDGTQDSSAWSPSHTYSIWGDYDVTFTINTAYGCQSQITHVVTIDEDLIFPNIITPNGDGSNDVFAIKNLNTNINFEDPDDYRTNELFIYDRWGKRVYYAENYDTYMKQEEIFEGEHVFSGEGLPDGEYYFVFKYKGKVKTVNYSGSLAIIRNNK